METDDHRSIPEDSFFGTDGDLKTSYEIYNISLNYIRMLYVIQLSPHWGFSVADYIKYYTYF